MIDLINMIFFLGYTMSEDEGKEEYEEVQKSLSKRETVDIEYNVIK